MVLATAAGIWYYVQSVSEASLAPFFMEVFSRPFTPLKGDEGVPMVLVGQRVVYLVVVKDTGEGNANGTAVDISATVSGAAVSVDNSAIEPGEVAEVIVIPDQVSVNKTLTIVISGNRGGVIRTETVEIEVIEGEDDLSEVAVQMRNKFAPWLAANHSELGITSETEWIGTTVNPRILVVMHYIFYSENWEMYVTWHVMIPPHDWTRIYLRPRFTETKSTFAFEISSVQGEAEPHSIELPDWV